MKGPHTIAAKEKISRALKAKWADPEYYERNAAILRRVSRSGGLASAAEQGRPILPKRGTPERKHIESWRRAIGTKALRILLRAGAFQ